MPEKKQTKLRQTVVDPTSLTIASVALLVGLAWANWPSLVVMAHRWASDAQYSHGYLVPVFACALLWLRRDQLDTSKLRPNWWGLIVLLAGVAARLSAAYFYYEWFDFVSLIPCIAGICLLCGGWHALRWSWPAIAFLFFMIPLPYTIEVAMRNPLRRVGTLASTYLMQTIGLPALAEGNVIVIDDVRIGVVEACSGLRMLMIFFALSTAVAILSDRALWQRLVIVLSAVPIALCSNITRISVTGILHGMQMSELADLVFHDLAGWLMMPFALLLLALELWFFSHLIITEEERPMAIGLQVEGHQTPAATVRDSVPVGDC